MQLDFLASRRRVGAAVLGLVVLALASPGCGGGGSGGSAQSATPPAAVPGATAASGAAGPSVTSPPPSGASPVPAAPSAPGSGSIAVPSDCAAPVPDASAARNDLWGAAPSAYLSTTPATWLPAMAAAGVTSVRNFSPGQLTPIIQAGMSVVGILQWSPGTTQTLPVDDLDGWRRYVATQVACYQGRVKYWEVWNEPPNGTVDTSPASYAKVVAAAFDAAKAVDPTVQIGLSAKSNHINWLAESIAAGAADKFDFVTLHPYEIADLLPQGWEGQFMAIAPRLRQMLRDKNPARAAVPLWFTEIGMRVAPTVPARVGIQVQADVLAKVYTMAIAQGVERIYWFDPSDSEGLTMGLTTADGTRRPAWFAMRSLSSVLGPRPGYAGWFPVGDGGWGFVFSGPQGVVFSAWMPPGRSATLALASDVTQIDTYTGASRTTRTSTLTEAPSLLVAPRGSPQALQWLATAAANTGRPFPWNSDHSHATSVQLTAGSPPDGVFMVTPFATTVVNGTAEISLEGSIGVCFAVDPVFLSPTYAYATTPLEVTVEVRGHGVGEPGFSFLYESDRPIAEGDVNGLVGPGDGWVPISGTTFSEKTWQLPNARFVGMFGYNFCLYAVGPVHSGFSIRRVTVRRTPGGNGAPG